MSIVVETSTLESLVRQLAGFTAERAPVTSCYLDVDGRRQPRYGDVERRLAAELRPARGRADDADLHRIEEWVRAGFDRSHTRGLAFFACDAHDLFEVVQLPMPVHDRVVVNHKPAVAQLEAILRDHEPIGILLADRQRARVLVYELGELHDRSELFDELPRDYDETGERDRGTVDGHVDALAAAHLRHGAAVAWQAYQDRPFHHLVLGGPDAVVAAIEPVLHPYLRDRLRGRLPGAVTVAATADELLRAAEEVAQRLDRQREAGFVARLRDAVGSGGRGVAGLADTLRALNERRVELLLVSEGYEEEGWRCPSSGALAAVGPTSPVTGGRMDRVDDIVEDAVELALDTGVRVEACPDNADLDVLGRIGALTRY